MNKKKRILAYFYHCQTLGHSRRILNICKALKSQYEIILVSGGEFPSYFKDAVGLEILQLPTLIPQRELFEGYQAKNLSLEISEVMKLREAMLKGLSQVYQADILLCEFIPFGRFFLHQEVKSLIKSCRKANKNLKVLSCMRDIWGIKQEERLEKRQLAIQMIEELFDYVLIHGVKEINDFAHEFPREVQKKFHFTGYVARELPLIKKDDFYQRYGLGHKLPLVIVSVGGGKDGQAVIDKMTEVAAVMSDVQFLMFSGPYASKKSLLTPDLSNVIFESFSDGLPAYYKHADLAVTMSGYNTMTDILQSKVASVVFPRLSEDEQMMRALALSERGRCHVVTEGASVKKLRKLFYQVMGSRKRLPRIDMSGTQATLELINKLF